MLKGLFPPGTPVSSTRKLISSPSFHRFDMILVVAEALNPQKTINVKRACHIHKQHQPVTSIANTV